MTAKKTAAKVAPPNTVDPAVIYQVRMTRPVATPAFVYRPGEDHRMSGDALLALAKEAGLAVEEFAVFEEI
ncbi:hypothetical protein [Methylopila sp. M107]|uniref:hypothetical protein n=1 Tax=Methylopila sp. M107 TaxID=1101190 RepID=UPI00036C8BC9|nr:hypothetical protein [Methylopila sp. M107]